MSPPGLSCLRQEKFLEKVKENHFYASENYYLRSSIHRRKSFEKVSTLLSRRPFLFEHAQRTKEIEPRRTIQ